MLDAINCQCGTNNMVTSNDGRMTQICLTCKKYLVKNGAINTNNKIKSDQSLIDICNRCDSRSKYNNCTK